MPLTIEPITSQARKTIETAVVREFQKHGRVAAMSSDMVAGRYELEIWVYIRTDRHDIALLERLIGSESVILENFPSHAVDFHYASAGSAATPIQCLGKEIYQRTPEIRKE